MEHKISKIQQDIKSLTKEDWEHIQNCQKCLNEYKLMKFIETSIAEIPEIKVPISLEPILNQTVFKPKYSIFYFLGIAIIVLLIPFQFKNINFLFFDYIFLITILYSTVIYLLLLMIISMLIFQNKKQILEKYSEKIDLFIDNIEKKLMKI